MRKLPVAAVACVIALGGCGSDDEGRTSAPAAATPDVTTTATPQATSTPAATATPGAEATAQALWPDPAQATDAAPEEVVRSWVKDAVGIERPAVGKFQAGEPGAGEVPVHRRGEDGTKLDALLATVSVRKLDGEHWFVTSAASPEVEIDSPEPLEEIRSPVHVAGRGRGFEGNVVLQVRRAFARADTEPLAEKPVVAGSMETLEPFEADLTFEAPSGGAGAIVALTGSGIAAANGFAAIPVRFG